MRYFVTLEGQEFSVDVSPRVGGGFEVRLGDAPVHADVALIGDTLSVIIDGKVVDLTVEGKPPRVGVVANGRRVYVDVESDRARAAKAAKAVGGPQGEGLVVSPMPGRVLKLLVAVGDEVAAGQSVVVVEAMKMENELRSTRAGVVQEIYAAAGANVESGAKLVRVG